MRLRNTFLVAITLSILFAVNSHAQTNQYKRAKPKPKAAEASAAPAKGPAKKADEKLDITDLEQKYWAPKDTDFSVVQNRTYTKANRYSASLLAGPIVNDPFNSGYNFSVGINYYFDERYGVEFMYNHSDLRDSKAVKNFASQLSGGAVMPDFNRPQNYMGVGFNWVPFYAKMSFLGKKIIYFDMQVTPHIGMSKYEQITKAGVPSDEISVFSYGFDVTQYFFFSKHMAVRANLHNRWYSEEIRAWQTGLSQSETSVNVTNFLIGVTLFY